ncbi:MAG: rhodanese-like domain-containing protein [Chitinophagales bacterium]|nr:rhodanese-like domain-containing protein [Chitinophagales bacterium]
MNFIKNLFGTNKNDEKESLVEILKKGATLVDVRTEAEFASGSVNGAINIPLDKLHLNIAKLKNKDNIILFCRSGNRSEQAKRILQSHGFKNVINGGSWMDVARYVN